MSKESGNLVAGGAILLGFFIVLICIIGALFALVKEQFMGAGMLMLAASLPTAVAVHSVFKKE